MKTNSFSLKYNSHEQKCLSKKLFFHFHFYIRSIANIIELLNSPHVDIRMACGEAIAVILERGRLSEESFLEEHLPNLIELTGVLSKDSQKHRGKKERKAQRATFRDVVRYLEVSF